MANESRAPTEVVRDIYAAMHAGDFDRLFELVAPDVVITQDPALPWGGRYEGHDGFATFGLTLQANIQSAVTIDAMFEADGDVIQFGHTRGTVVANGTSFDIPEVHRWQIRDDQAISAHFAIDTAAMLRALSGES